MKVIAHIIAFLVIGFLLNIVGLPLILTLISFLGVEPMSSEGKHALVSVAFVLNAFYTAIWIYLIGVSKDV